MWLVCTHGKWLGNLLLRPQSQRLHGECSLVPLHSTGQIRCHISPRHWSKYCHLTLQLHISGPPRRPRQFLACKKNSKACFSIWVCFRKKKTFLFMQTTSEDAHQTVWFSSCVLKCIVVLSRCLVPWPVRCMAYTGYGKLGSSSGSFFFIFFLGVESRALYLSEMHSTLNQNNDAKPNKTA